MMVENPLNNNTVRITVMSLTKKSTPNELSRKISDTYRQARQGQLQYSQVLTGSRFSLCIHEAI